MIHHVLNTDLAFSAQVACGQMSAATQVPMRGSVAQAPMAEPKPVAKKMPVQPKAPPPKHLTTKVEVQPEAPPPKHLTTKVDVQPKARPRKHLAKKIELKPNAPPPSDSGDHDDCLHHGVAEVQTDGVGENDDGQVIDMCAVKFKNLTLHLDKAVIKLYLQDQLSMSDDGIY